MTTGELVKKWRVAAGLRQEDVEARTNGEISQAYLSSLEKGRVKEPSLRKAILLADVLGHDVRELLGEEEEAVARLQPAMVAAWWPSLAGSAAR